MKRSIRKFISASIILITPGIVKAQGAYISLKYVDPLQKVFKETAFFPDIPAQADVARGEYATFQFAFRSNVPVKDLNAIIQADASKDAFIARNASVGYVGYVWVGRPLPQPPPDKLTSASGFFPDPILDTVPSVLPPDCTQPVWISVKIPKNMEAGWYDARLIVKGKALGKGFSRRADFRIHVYPVTIDSTSLWITQWYDTSPLAFSMMNRGKDVSSYSPRYWELLSVLAHKMADYDENVVLVSPLRLAQYGLKNGKYTFDFSRFDKTILIFKNAGALKRIEGGHFGARMGGWNSDIGVLVPVIKPDTVILEKHLMTDQPAQDFYSQFIPALMKHLKEKGWYDIYMQHISDEPTDANYASYTQVTDFVKKLAPGVPLIDACHTNKVKLDIWVPQLDFFHKGYKFYQQQQKEGSEVWFYTCMWPEGNYASRYIEVPLARTRIMHWINFRYGATGYLYWSFNPGKHGPHPFAETTDQNDQEGGGILPAGDSYIVYPGYGKLYSSIRLDAMRDGINDYELLKMLSRKYPDKAKDICSRVVIGFDVYDTEIQSFREKRREILEWLSAPAVSAPPEASGWETGMQAWSLRAYSFFETVDTVKSMGLQYIEAFPQQKIGGGIEGAMDFKMGHGKQQKILAYLKDKGVKLMAYGVVVPQTAEEWRQLFAFAHSMGIRNIVSDPDPKFLTLISQLCNRYNVNVCLHNNPLSYRRSRNPDTTLADIRRAGNNRLGVCADIGNWVRAGYDPVESLKKLQGHVIEVHMKDLLGTAVDAEDTVWGSGNCHIKEVLEELHRQHFKGLISVEYESHPVENIPQMRQSLEFLQKTIQTFK